LNLGRLKHLKVTKDDLFNAISESEKVEINGDGTGIRVKRRPLGELEDNRGPGEIKKLKTEKGEARSPLQEAMKGEVDT